MTITWGRKSRRTLGHYDRAKRTIVISSLLDGPDVPDYIIEYVVFHEMLHHEFPTYYRHGRRVIHSRSFKEKERTYPHYDRAQEWLKKDFKKVD